MFSRSRTIRKPGRFRSEGAAPNSDSSNFKRQQKRTYLLCGAVGLCTGMAFAFLAGLFPLGLKAHYTGWECTQTRYSRSFDGDGVSCVQWTAKAATDLNSSRFRYR